MGSTPISRSIKIATPAGCGYFYGNRGNLKCSAEVNSACAEVLPAAKRSYGAAAQLARKAGDHAEAKEELRHYKKTLFGKWVRR